MKKNDGQVLIIVLLVLTLTMIFVITLFPLIIQSAKQATLSEENMQTKHAAEMGMTLFEKMFDQIMDKKEFHSTDELQNEVQNSTPTNPISLNDHVAYQLNVHTATVKKNNDSVITITVDSYGLYDGKQKKDLQKTYTVTFRSNDHSGSKKIFTNISDFDVLKDPSFLNFGNESFRINYNINLQSHYIGNYNFPFYSLLLRNIDVSHDAIFQNDLYIPLNLKFKIGNSALFNDDVLLFTGNLQIGNAMYAQNEIHAFMNSSLTVGGNASVNELYASNSRLLFSSNLYVKYLQLFWYSKMEVDGSMYLSSATIGPGSTLTVNGNLYSDSLTVSDWPFGGKVCVHGKAENIRTNADVIYNKSSCDNQPEGTIYVLNQPVDSQNDGSSDNKIVTVEEGDVIYK
ncbi:MAG: hypothetical protein IMW92_05555 [Bacillales bacterium]|nr:hypothetical protein [Bacillales bacterium]